MDEASTRFADVEAVRNLLARSMYIEYATRMRAFEELKAYPPEKHYLANRYGNERD